MKKRLISMLLTVLMVMSLFTGMSTTAYADNAVTVDPSYYTEVTLGNGDYVLKLCQKLGINYYTCKDAIMLLNGITSEGQFSKLPVGKVIKLPVSDAAAVKLVAENKGTGTGTGTSGGGTANVSSSDAVAYYLIPYTMQAGETVAGVCNALGINFSAYANQIQKLNNISSWTKVRAGSTLLLPTNTTPAVGTTCYAVLAHKVASGESAYTICQKNGVDYGKNTKLLQALNNSSNLSNIKAGNTFYLAALTTVQPNNNNNNNNNNNKQQ